MNHLSRTCFGVLIVAAGMLAVGGALRAQDANTGWIEGTVLNPSGKIVTGNAWGDIGVDVRFIPATGQGVQVHTSPEYNGLYSAKGIKAGVYEVL